MTAGIAVGAQSAGARLGYLDGLRALAAVGVTVVHAVEMPGLGDETPRALLLLYDAALRKLALAVQVFIVLSGFSLMLPLARADTRRLADGAAGFFRRRAWRILPPYYAALALSLLLIAAVPGLNRPAGVYWDRALPALEPRAILAHLLLVHNAAPLQAFSTINPPLWSIAVECQIYLLFPALLWLWRARGGRVALPAALAYGVALAYLPLPALPLSTGWFVGLFALGMAGAYLAYSPCPPAARWRRRLPWGPLALAGAATLVTLALVQRITPPGPLAEVLSARWLEDYLLGLTMLAFLVRCATAGGAGATGRGWGAAVRALEWVPLVRVGRFSYSLYLVHAPILAAVALACRTLDLPVPLEYGVVLAAGVPLAVLLAYGFFLLFERPFLAARSGAASSRPATARATLT